MSWSAQRVLEYHREYLGEPQNILGVPLESLGYPPRISWCTQRVLEYPREYFGEPQTDLGYLRPYWCSTQRVLEYPQIIF